MSDSTPEETTKALVRRSFEALEDRDRDAFEEVFAEDFVVQPYGIEREQFVADEFAFYDAFPDLSYELDELLAEGDRVAFRWSMTGTHTGQGGPSMLAELEPTGEAIDVTGMNIARVEDGQIAEWWAEWGTLELFHQLGVVTLPGE